MLSEAALSRAAAHARPHRHGGRWPVPIRHRREPGSGGCCIGGRPASSIYNVVERFRPCLAAKVSVLFHV